MPQSDTGTLVLTRVRDLEPGQRVRLPRMSRTRLQTVVGVEPNDGGTLTLSTDLGAYVCDPTDMVDVEDAGEAW